MDVRENSSSLPKLSPANYSVDFPQVDFQDSSGTSALSVSAVLGDMALTRYDETFMFTRYFREILPQNVDFFN